LSRLYVRRIVARILSYFGGAKATEAFVGLFNDEDDEVRGSALTALGSCRYTPLVPQIVPLLQNDHWCWRAALALGNMGDPSVVDALLETLSKVTTDDSMEMEVECIIEALGKLGDSRAIPAILPFLHADEDTQCVAANALTFLGHPDAKRFLLERLSTGSGDYGNSVADGLLHLGAQLVPELLEALEQDPTQMVPFQVLRELRDPRAIPCLTRLLAFDSQTLPTDHPLLSELQRCSGGLREETLRGMIQDTVRGAAAGVLGELGESSCVSALLTCLTTSTSDWSCYITIPHVLKKLGDHRAILPLTQVLVNSSNNLNEAAHETLLSFGERSTPALLEMLKHGTEALRLAALYTLAQLHDPQALPPIQQLAEDSQQPEYLRKAARIALICITGELA
jgi:HEAT repeat protein